MKKLKADSLLLKNATVITFDKAAKKQDILIQRGKIKDIGSIDAADFSGTVLDLTDHVISPGLMDMHVHLREPGREDEETIESGCAAAAAGGFTAVAAMPNTFPPCDTQEIVKFLLERSANELVNVHPIATISKKRQGKEISEMADLKRAGAVAFSDDGGPVTNTLVMRYALQYANMLQTLIIDHSEDPHLFKDGHMNEGVMSTRLGIQGIPNAAESSMIARNIELVKLTGGALHVAHISAAESVELVRRAKAEGLPVTCEVTPHHLIFSDEDLTTFDTHLKMNPPLRSKKDIEALKAALQDGTIDVIASDHAPHSIEEKDVEFEAAPFGITGLETMLGAILQHIVEPGILELEQALYKMCIGPRHVLNLPVPQMTVGKAAELSIFAPNQSWTVDPHAMQSQSINTPFGGHTLPGAVFGVVNNGMFWQNTD